jgi:REP element-mobilizing transposase RayT
MDRVWLLTWTTYGSWLPGDRRGPVARTRDGPGSWRPTNVPGTSPAPMNAGLLASARRLMRGPPVRLGSGDARVLDGQLRETASIRGWTLLAVAIMANHVHIVVGVRCDPEPSALLRDFKAWGSRALSRHAGRPESGTWWTASGSAPRLQTDANIVGAVEYVRRQEYPLVVWSDYDTA